MKKKQERLDTEHLEVEPLSIKSSMNLFMVMLSPTEDTRDWIFNPDEEFDPDVSESKLEIPFIVRIIRKRILGENLKIGITKKAYFVIAILTKGNPGKGMFILHKIGNFFETRKDSEWLVTSITLMDSLFPMGFLTEEAFSKWWEMQKTTNSKGWSANRVDIFPDKWRRKEVKK